MATQRQPTFLMLNDNLVSCSPWRTILTISLSYHNSVIPSVNVTEKEA